MQYWLDHEGGWILLVFVNPSIGSPSGFSSIVCLLPHWVSVRIMEPEL